MLLHSKLEEEAILNLEFKAGSRLSEIIDLRNNEERKRKLRMDVHFREQQTYLHDRLLEERWKTEDEELRLKREMGKH